MTSFLATPPNYDTQTRLLTSSVLAFVARLLQMISIAKAGASSVTISARNQETGEKAVARLSAHTPSCQVGEEKSKSTSQNHNSLALGLLLPHSRRGVHVVSFFTVC